MDGNPYDILQVKSGADRQAIDAAYDRLYDSYEPQAQGGDEDAIAALEQLNEAHEVLTDPVRRAELDSSLGISAGSSRSARRVGAAQGATTGGTAVKEESRTTSTTTSVSAGKAASRGRGSSNAYRPRAVTPVQKASSPMPLVFGGVLVVLAVLVVVFLIARNNGSATGSGGPVSTDKGQVVATVNGQPVYESDYLAKSNKDRTNAANDPMVGPLLAAGGITATRMLDVINQDALDKLINMEVIQQQAKKDSLYPSDQQKQDLVTQAKATDLKGQSFDDFLKANGLTAQQYEDNVVRNVVYAVVASKHMPDNGTDDERINAFLTWLCETRNGYDVKINLKFTVENKACTSGLPSDIPLTGLTGDQGTQVPEDVPTTAPQVPQGATPAPK